MLGKPLWFFLETPLDNFVPLEVLKILKNLKTYNEFPVLSPGQICLERSSRNGQGAARRLRDDYVAGQGRVAGYGCVR